MIALWATSVALAGPLLQIGTGQRVLGVPGTETVLGGGTRLGLDLGVAVPFVGGNLTRVHLTEELEEWDVSGTLWSLAAGLRADLASEDRLLQPFVAGGLSVGGGDGRVELEDFDEAYEVDVDIGPGIFAGAGADAILLPSLSIGLEVGGQWASGDLTTREEYDEDDFVENYDLTGAWTYVDLHVVFRPGAK